LIGRGYQVRIFDDKVQLSQLIGANKSFLEKELPHISSLLCPSMQELVDVSEVLVLTNGTKEFKQIPEMMKPDQILIDLIGTAKGIGNLDGRYDGICW